MVVDIPYGKNIIILGGAISDTGSLILWTWFCDLSIFPLFEAKRFIWLKRSATGKR